MATTTMDVRVGHARHAAPATWDWQDLATEKPWIRTAVYAGLFLAALFVVSLLLGEAYAYLAAGPYLRGAGLAEAAPLGSFALVMSIIYWMPLFMPALIPLAMLTVLLFAPFRAFRSDAA